MNIVDRVVSMWSPEKALKRVISREKLDFVEKRTRRHEGAAGGPRMSGFYGQSMSVNQLIYADRSRLVARSRDLSINNPYAKKAPNTIGNNVVGTGILPNVTAKSKANAKRVKDAWKEWGETLSCDFDGHFNFYGLQKLVMKTISVSGEMLIVRKRVDSEECKFGIQLLALEGDFIDSTKHSYVAGYSAGKEYDCYGIRFNEKGKKTGYWIYDGNPLEGCRSSTLVPIKDVIHVYPVDRAQQQRGLPFASSTILKQRDLDDYEDAELLGKKAAACFSVFVQNTAPEGDGNGSDKIENLEPGTVQYLQNGESVEFASPPQNPTFGEFTRTQHRAIANGYGLTYEQYTGDLSNVNFSSGRMGWIEFSKQVDDWQYLLMIPRMCDKAFGWFLEACEIVLGVKKDSVGVTWTAPRREMIDPVKEVTGLIKKMRAGLGSWQEVVRELGYNPEEVMQELKDDHESFVKNGLMPECDPSFELGMKKGNVKSQ